MCNLSIQHSNLILPAILVRGLVRTERDGRLLSARLTARQLQWQGWKHLQWSNDMQLLYCPLTYQYNGQFSLPGQKFINQPPTQQQPPPQPPTRQPTRPGPHHPPLVNIIIHCLKRCQIDSKWSTIDINFFTSNGELVWRDVSESESHFCWIAPFSRSAPSIIRIPIIWLQSVTCRRALAEGFSILFITCL